MNKIALYAGLAAACLILYVAGCELERHKQSQAIRHTPASVQKKNDAASDSLRRFVASVRVAPPETVQVSAPRYIRLHDTLWRCDTIIDPVARLTEVSRWLMLSDSTQRQKLDSVTRMDSLCAHDRDSLSVSNEDTVDSLRSERTSIHWKDVAIGASATFLLLSAGVSAIILK